MSEFGTGLIYCLGLFLAHAERYKYNLEGNEDLWFDAASDHLYELQIPDTLSDDLRAKLSVFRDTVLELGHGIHHLNPTEKDVEWAILEASILLMEIDKYYGITVEEADWK